MAEAPIRIETPHLLLVEGNDEARYWGAVFKAWQREDIQVVPFQGKDNLRWFLDPLVRTPDFRAVRWLGIMRDADDDAGRAFQSVRDALRRQGLAAPGRAWQTAAGQPATAALILPDGTEPGDLEALILRTLRPDARLACIDAYVACLTSTGNPPVRLGKTRFYAYLASLDRPDRRLGEALEAGRLSTDHPELDRVRRMLPTTAGGVEAR